VGVLVILSILKGGKDDGLKCLCVCVREGDQNHFIQFEILESVYISGV